MPRATLMADRMAAPNRRPVPTLSARYRRHRYSAEATAGGASGMSRSRSITR
jgi:hypothetical protein